VTRVAVFNCCPRLFLAGKRIFSLFCFSVDLLIEAAGFCGASDF